LPQALNRLCGPRVVIAIGREKGEDPMATEGTVPPRVFVSYSWSSASHELWVVELAEKLRTDGVDVVLDKWDLKEGQDKYAFMEKMVTDRHVVKVLAICDAQYAQKADARKGGVGTESQIISKEVYEKADQTKFIAVVCEVDPVGKPCLPAFLGSRIYIDFSSAEKYNDNYPMLVRCIFNKPLYEKPPLGTPPAYINEETLAPSKTRGKLELLKNAILQDKPLLIIGLAVDYTTNWYNSLAELRVEWKGDLELDETIVASIRKSLLLRDEFVEFLQVTCKFSNDDNLYECIGETYQELLKLCAQPDDRTTWFPELSDNFRFLDYELFLYLTSTLVQHRRLSELDKLLTRLYFDPMLRTEDHPNGGFVGFSVFNRPCTILEKDWKNKRQLRRMSIMADILNERATRKDVSFELLMQADLVLFLRSILHPRHDEKCWVPRTLVFRETGRQFDFFAKAASKRYFEQLMKVLGVKNKDEIVQGFIAASKRGDPAMGWLIANIDIPTLADFGRLDTEH
jgi:hypothetical protein